MPMPPATKTYLVPVSSGSRNDPFGSSTSTSSPTSSSSSVCLKAVSRRRVASPTTPRLGRRSDDRDVSAQALVVVVAAVRQLDPEVVAGPVGGVVVHREEHQQRPLRDLPLLCDGRAHVSRDRGRRAGSRRAGSAARAASGRRSTRPPRRSRAPPSPPRAARGARASSICFTSTASSTSAIARSSSTLKKPGPVANSSTSSVARSR